MGREKKYLANANEYLAFLYVGSTFVETRQETGRRAHSGIRHGLLHVRNGLCCTSIRVISYNDVGIATGDNFIEHGQDVIILFQSCRIGCGSYEDEMILNG